MLPTIPICANEPGRLDALRSTGLLDTPAEATFDGITWLAKTQLSAPMSAISLVDRDRQWFKSRQNLDIVETPRDVSFCTHALVTEHPFIVMDTSRDTRFAHSPMVVGPPQVRFYLGMPLITKERFALGALCVYDTTPRAAVTPDQLNAMSILARLATDAIELRRIAESDGLTNLMTRSAFRRGATAELSRCKRHRMNAACLVADIDEFKRINDTLGHAVGDYVLRTAAATLRRELRPYDLLGRVGGEEFAILLPNTSAEEAVNVAERLRLALAVAPMAVADAQLVVTASFGISDGSACALDVDSMLGQADTAMYESKRAGRNRTTRFDAGGALMAIQ